MKKYFCDFCEQEMLSPWLTIQIDDSVILHYCRKCAERILAAIQEMEERKEGEE